jgi:hypothetical protein
VGSNPGIAYWMDVSVDASYYLKEKIENKDSQMGRNLSRSDSNCIK